ncbi:uncharacterized protein CDAR_451471 [Caerostris darwini]|uniref:Gustatory receptor n=1 Tax=Caerostris darwini TaxID=1538125 RepID=A0AAV4SE49_9ARAC|nr:uncharacterized protein CDAR_451471 [Caerostris darwini]
MVVRDISFGMVILGLHCTLVSLPGFYCFVCKYFNLKLNEFLSTSKILIVQKDYRRIFKIYQELARVLTFIDDFLCYSAFVFVLCGMVGLFWSICSFILFFDFDYLIYFCSFVVSMHYLMMMQMIILPASDINLGAQMARDVIISLPGWFPQQHDELKIRIRRGLNKKIGLTLWKIYKIDKSLFISAIGTLITYGVLVGTLGSIHSSQKN